MKKVETKKPILPILREMKVDDIEEWERKRAFSIAHSIQRLQIATDNKKKFTKRINFTTIQVKRIK